MKTEILKKLEAIEPDYGIKILFACESGSRGWGFPSPDSDYDVRFIYIRPKKDYLSIDEKKQELRFAISDELDINGWDLKKVLRLMIKSNTTPFEWLQSPTVYRSREGFHDKLWALCQDYYSQRINTHHYLGIAIGALDSLSNLNTIKIKKLFYVLRPMLASKWCLEKNSIAPMEMRPLMELLPDPLKAEVDQLISRKSKWDEAHMITVSDRLLQFIYEEKANISKASSDLPRQIFSSQKLNDFFTEAIALYDDQ